MIRQLSDDAQEVPLWLRPHPESYLEFRVPSCYGHCRRARCHGEPVADMLRSRSTRWGLKDSWWAYCAEHLADYNREVRDGVVWWRGAVP